MALLLTIGLIGNVLKIVICALPLSFYFLKIFHWAALFNFILFQVFFLQFGWPNYGLPSQTVCDVQGGRKL
jgi:hypothetical protein